MSTVLFACGTEYHVLMAFMLATTTYAESPKILLLYATNRTLPYLERARASGIWDEVILIEPDAPATAYEASWADLLTRASVLHMFTWGFPHFNTLMAQGHANGLSVILTDEGLHTYSPRRRFADWIAQKHDGVSLTQGFTFEAIREIWLLAPALFAETPWCPLRAIDVSTFVSRCRENSSLRACFERLFDLENVEPVSAEAVYFRQYFPLLEVLPPELDAWLDDALTTVFSPVRLAIKNHPAWFNPLVKQAGNNFPAADRPWEALVLWAYIQHPEATMLPRVYLSLTSSAMLKTALLGVTGTYLFLHRLLARYSGWQDISMDDLIERLSANFPHARFIAPANWEDLSIVLAELTQREGWRLNLDALPTVADEIAILRDVSLTYWRQSREQARRLHNLEQDFTALRAQVAQKDALLREVVRLMTLTADILKQDLRDG